MGPLVCYQCLDNFDVEPRAQTLRKCSVARHANFLHESRRGSMCAFCSPPYPKLAKKLCDTALDKLSTNASQAAPLLFGFLDEISRLCKRDDEGEVDGTTNSAMKQKVGGAVMKDGLTLADLFDAGVCEAIFNIMSGLPDDPALLSASLLAITALAEAGYQDPTHRLGEARRPGILCQSMELHCSTLSVVKRGLGALVAILDNDAGLVANMYEAGALRAVAKAVRPHYSRTLSIWAVALRGLRILLSHVASNGDGDGGRTEACELLYLMLKAACVQEQWEREEGADPLDIAELKCQLCRLIDDVINDKAIAQTFFDLGTARYLCVLLTKSRSEEAIQVSACRVVCKLSTHCPAAQTYFGDFMPTLLKRMLDTHGASTPAVDTALRTAASLCLFNPKTAEAFGASGMCEFIIGCWQSSQGSTVQEAVRAFHAMSIENAERFRALNASELLHAKFRRLLAEAQGTSLIEEIGTSLKAFDDACSNLPPLFAPPSPDQQADIEEGSHDSDVQASNVAKILAAAASQEAALESAFMALSPRQQLQRRQSSKFRLSGTDAGGTLSATERRLSRLPSLSSSMINGLLSSSTSEGQQPAQQSAPQQQQPPPLARTNSSRRESRMVDPKVSLPRRESSVSRLLPDANNSSSFEGRLSDITGSNNTTNSSGPSPSRVRRSPSTMMLLPEDSTLREQQQPPSPSARRSSVAISVDATSPSSPTKAAVLRRDSSVARILPDANNSSSFEGRLSDGTTNSNGPSPSRVRRSPSTMMLLPEDSTLREQQQPPSPSARRSSVAINTDGTLPSSRTSVVSKGNGPLIPARRSSSAQNMVAIRPGPRRSSSFNVRLAQDMPENASDSGGDQSGHGVMRPPLTRLQSGHGPSFTSATDGSNGGAGSNAPSPTARAHLTRGGAEGAVLHQQVDSEGAHRLSVIASPRANMPTVAPPGAVGALVRGCSDLRAQPPNAHEDDHHSRHSVGDDRVSGSSTATPSGKGDVATWPPSRTEGVPLSQQAEERSSKARRQSVISPHSAT